MDAFLAGELTIVVAANMERYVGISDIVPQVGRKLEDLACILLFECCGKLLFYAGDPPGHYAIAVQGIFRIFDHCFFPTPREGVEGVGAVMININKVTRSLCSKDISSFVGIDGMFGKERNIRLVKPDHFGREQKDRVVVDLFVGKEAPAKAGMIETEAKRE
jgi:hypothetical protein